MVLIKHYGLLKIYKWRSWVIKAVHREVYISRCAYKWIEEGTLKMEGPMKKSLWFSGMMISTLRWHKTLYKLAPGDLSSLIPFSSPSLPDNECRQTYVTRLYVLAQVSMPSHESAHWHLAHLYLPIQSLGLLEGFANSCKQRAPSTSPDTSACSHEGRK